jgi:hypothetical protein
MKPKTLFDQHPAVKAECERIISRIAEQMYCSRAEARQALYHFERIATSDGQAVH